MYNVQDAGHFKDILPLGYQYIGCLLVAVTSIIFILLYMNKTQDKNALGESSGCKMNASHHACILAKETFSYLGYLKKLDQHSSVTFPFHCRTIDFYLACKGGDELPEQENQKSSDKSTRGDPREPREHDEGDDDANYDDAEDDDAQEDNGNTRDDEGNVRNEEAKRMHYVTKNPIKENL